uniref:Poly [ADP-ribose] polymerase n=1 Tax=Panagrolaimus sp. ES5 TaxID=591445 RepID=A0AC34GC68_9BILA
ELRHGLKEEHVKEATTKFYSLIPHIKAIDHDLPLLNNPRIIDSKASMLNTLADIEIANRSIGEMILQHEYISRKDVIQRYYEKLNCRITIVDQTSETFQLIKEYAETNHRVTDNFKLEIINVFEIFRPDEEAAFKKEIGNIRLLWHGSRTVNFIGILSQGLHLPEKPRDLWFVALGDIDRKNNLDFEIIKPEESKHSVKGMGMYYPFREGYRTIDDNVTVPIGKLIKRQNVDDLLLDYNEYIVYSTEQIKIRYLVQVNIGKKGVTRKNGLIGGEAV